MAVRFFFVIGVRFTYDPETKLRNLLSSQTRSLRLTLFCRPVLDEINLSLSFDPIQSTIKTVIDSRYKKAPPIGFAYPP